MTAASSERTRAIILRRTNFGEADRVLSLLTPRGQVAAIARGVRREKSRLAGGIELFAISDMTLHSGKGKLRVVTSARLEVFFDHIISDYERLEFGYEATRMITRASDDIDSSAWFTILENTYRGLDSTKIDIMLTKAWFYLNYAEVTGYALNLTRDVDGELLTPDRSYSYDVVERGLRVREGGEITASHIKFLRIVAAKPLLAVSQIGGVEDILNGCYLLARQAASI